MDQINPGILVVPRGLPDLSPLKLDLGEINSVESRIQEVAFVNPVKAPELLAVFNKAYSDLVSIISTVEYEFQMAKKHSNEVRAMVLIDRVPEKLKEKGLTSAKSPGGSEDFRQAILDLDKDYSAAQDKVIQLKCIITLLEGKQKSIDMAYSSVKKVLGESSQYRHSQSLAVEQNQSTGFFKSSKY